MGKDLCVQIWLNASDENEITYCGYICSHCVFKYMTHGKNVYMCNNDKKESGRGLV